MMLAETTWPDVALTAIPTIAAIASAYIAYLVRRDVRTPSGTRLGTQVEDTRHTVLSNNYHLQSIGGRVGAAVSPAANGEAAKVEALRDPEPGE